MDVDDDLYARYRRYRRPILVLNILVWTSLTAACIGIAWYGYSHTTSVWDNAVAQVRLHLRQGKFVYLFGAPALALFCLCIVFGERLIDRLIPRWGLRIVATPLADLALVGFLLVLLLITWMRTSAALEVFPR